MEDDQASVEIVPQQSDLSLELKVNEPKPNVGELVTLRLTLANAGPDAATNVRVACPLPEGLEFVPSSGGTFDGEWNWVVDKIEAGTSEEPRRLTSTIFARVTGPGPKTVEAEVVAADQYDPDSPHGNNNALEDDQASVEIVPLGRLSGTVWLDRDLDGSQGANEPGMDGVTVYLDLDGDGTRDPEDPCQETSADDPATPDVDESGRYEFRGLEPRKYRVRIEAPKDHRIVFPNESQEHAHIVDMGIGEIVGGADFGSFPADVGDDEAVEEVVKTEPEEPDGVDGDRPDEGGTGVGGPRPPASTSIVESLRLGWSGGGGEETETVVEAEGTDAESQDGAAQHRGLSAPMPRQAIPVSLAVCSPEAELSALLRDFAFSPAVMSYQSGEQVPDLDEELPSIDPPPEVDGLDEESDPLGYAWLWWIVVPSASLGVLLAGWWLWRRRQSALATLRKARTVQRWEVWERAAVDSDEIVLAGESPRDEDRETSSQDSGTPSAIEVKKHG